MKLCNVNNHIKKLWTVHNIILITGLIYHLLAMMIYKIISNVEYDILKLFENISN